MPRLLVSGGGLRHLHRARDEPLDSMNLEDYLPLIIMILTGLGFGVVSIKAHEILGPRRPTREKESTYESGMEPVKSAHERFSVKYYLVAMLFILFDIEVVFMYPWATTFKDFFAGGFGTLALLAMLLFIVTLLFGYIYILKKGALKWD
ncbi:MAG: NADH-quinone oxidoreductase subunit A [Candidatus Kapaibacterium sp.]